MNEPGAIRRRDDGTFEYLRSQSVSMRRGVVETWESAVEHAAKHMRLPGPFLENLRAAGYRGGPHLYDLMIAEGWRAPDRSYIEIEPVNREGVVAEPRQIGAFTGEPSEPIEAGNGAVLEWEEGPHPVHDALPDFKATRE
jgi:hypothetical protein